MAIWPTDDPTGTHPSEETDPCTWCGRPDCDEQFGCDTFDRADLDAATRADLWIDEQSGTDYDGPDWPF